MNKKAKIVLGVTGSIAAYKAAELLRLMIKRGWAVSVVMTRAATRFVGEITFQTLSRNPVLLDEFERKEVWDPAHVSLADWADLLVIAPCTANVIAKLAHGLADDALTSTALACRAPLIIAPAMNENMWRHPATKENLGILKKRGAIVIDPERGELACGWVGEGRLASLEEIMKAVEKSVMKFLVTAGPTREPIDPVRFISNRSSGKMGYAIAAVARKRGHSVILISGPVAIDSPAGVKLIKVITAAEMLSAVKRNIKWCDAFVMAAAVADWRPAKSRGKKIKKNQMPGSLPLARNPDILLAVAPQKERRIYVGFAAETGNPRAEALRKLRRKKLDMIVANDVTRADAGFEVDTNRVTLYSAGGAYEQLPLMRKTRVAERIVKWVEQSRSIRRA